MNTRRPPGADGTRRVPTWFWVTVLVLGFHLLLFWAVSGRKVLPLAAPWLPDTVTNTPAPRPPADFSARETAERDPATGEVVVGQEFTVPARLATPPPMPTPSPTAAR